MAATRGPVVEAVETWAGGRPWAAVPMALAALLLLGSAPAAAQRAAAPDEATVFIRLVGRVHIELDDAGIARQTIDRDRVEIGTGSGFVISPHGYVLTNEHVIAGGTFTVTEGLRKATITLDVASIKACLPPGPGGAVAVPRCFEASVHSSDRERDLAVLFIGASDLPYVAFGDSDVVRAGQSVQALGYPFGLALEIGRVADADAVPAISTSAGTISALRADDTGALHTLQINSTVNPGNSGGPVVDRDGFAVGVVQARLTGDAGIGFAIPINRAKDFLASNGLEASMPTRRSALGALQRLDGKGLAIRTPDNAGDTSPFRARVETDPQPGSVALRIDRVVSPWSARRLEQALVASEGFEPWSIETSESQAVSRSGSAPLLLGRGAGNAVGMADLRTIYGVLELGNEKLVARYVGPAESVAYNEHVLRDSLLSLEGRRLTAGEAIATPSVEWTEGSGTSAVPGVPLPAGWIVEPAAPSPCRALPAPVATASAYPVRDVTTALRVAVWGPAVPAPQDAAAACAARRGAGGAASYVSRIEWLGVSYLVEGVFVRLDSKRLAQMEVIAPEPRAAASRALLAAWVARVSLP